MSTRRVKAKAPRIVAGKSRFLRRRRIAQGASDVERGLPDTERRGVPSDVPSRRKK
jgi:hypothetical protein